MCLTRSHVDVDTRPIIEWEVSPLTLMSCVLLRTAVPLTAPASLLLFLQLEASSVHQCLCFALCQVVWIIFYTALHFDWRDSIEAMGHSVQTVLSKSSVETEERRHSLGGVGARAHSTTLQCTSAPWDSSPDYQHTARWNWWFLFTTPSNHHTSFHPFKLLPHPPLITDHHTQADTQANSFLSFLV